MAKKAKTKAATIAPKNPAKRGPGRPRKNPDAAPAAPAPKKAAAARQPKRYSSPIDDEARKIFIQTLPKIAELRAKLNTANSNLRNAYKAAKADGFQKHDFEIAFKIQEAEGERGLKTAMARDLTIADWMGSDIGKHKDMFMDDPVVQIADRAFDEGKRASMEGKTADPSSGGYQPATEGYKAYMEGWHADQTKRMKKGIKPLHSEVQANRNAQVELDDAVAAQKAADEQAFEDRTGSYAERDPDMPTSGTPISRAQLNRMREEGTGIFHRKAN